MLTAKTAKVRISSAYEIDGLMGEDGEFYVSVSQVATLFQLTEKNPSSTIKGLLGITSSFIKVQPDTSPKAVNVLTLLQFERLTLELVAGQNKTAISIMRDSVGRNLRQLSSDGFKVQLGAEERNDWDDIRAITTLFSGEFFNQIKVWMSQRECGDPKATHYADVFDAINVGLFGKTAETIREELGLSSGTGLQRDHFGPRALYLIRITQREAARYMKLKPDMSPVVAVKYTITVTRTPVVDYRL